MYLPRAEEALRDITHLAYLRWTISRKAKRVRGLTKALAQADKLQESSKGRTN